MAGPVEEKETPIPADDLEMILDAIKLVVTTGSGYGDVVITFKRGQMDLVIPKPQYKPERSR